MSTYLSLICKLSYMFSWIICFLLFRIHYLTVESLFEIAILEIAYRWIWYWVAKVVVPIEAKCKLWNIILLSYSLVVIVETLCTLWLSRGLLVVKFCYCLAFLTSCDIGHLRCELWYVMILIRMRWYKVCVLKLMRWDKVGLIRVASRGTNRSHAVW